VIERIISGFAKAGLDLDDQQWADVLWLAAALAAGELPGPAPGSPTDASGHETTADVEVTATEMSDPRTETARRSRPFPPSERTPVAAGVVRAVAPDPAGHAVSLTRSAALPRRLGLARSLRPLARRISSPRVVELDVEATVTSYAETGTLLPMLRSGRERWFDLDLVLDTAGSMALWRELVGEIGELLTQRGAFRAVHQWTLDQSGPVPIVRDQIGTARHLASLRPGGGRRVVLLVSDGLGPAWYGEHLWKALRQWGRLGPVAVFQVLPSQLWGRTGIGVPDMTLFAGALGQPTASLPRSRPWWTDPDEACPEGLPVVALEAGDVAAWVGLITGRGSGDVTGISLGSRDEAGPPTGAPSDPRRVVQVFKSSSSAQAYQLAVLLSAVPLVLPVIRQVQSALVPGSTPAQLAEVLVSRLVKPSPQAGAGAPFADFRPGVREVLQSFLTSAQGFDVIRMASGYLQASVDASQSYTALLAGLDPEDADPRVRPFLEASGPLLERLGLAGSPQARIAPAPSIPTLVEEAEAAETREGVEDAAVKEATPKAATAPAPSRSDKDQEWWADLDLGWSADLVVAEKPGSGGITWWVASPHLTSSFSLVFDLPSGALADARSAVMRLMRPQSIVERRRLDELGRILAAQWPASFWDAYTQVAGIVGGQPPRLVVVSPDVMALSELTAVPSGADPSAPSLLGCQARLTRRLSPAHKVNRAMRFRSGPSLVVVPAYEPRAAELPGAGAEPDLITQSLPRAEVIRGRTATLEAVRAQLRSGDVQVLHLAGHGGAEESGSETGFFLLAGGARLTPRLVLDAPVVPVVVLNFWPNQDLVSAFLRSGAGAVVAPFTSVPDLTATIFTETFYPYLAMGVPIAEAVRRVRAQSEALNAYPVLLAYQVFGNPDLSIGPPAQQPPDAGRAEPGRGRPVKSAGLVDPKLVQVRAAGGGGSGWAIGTRGVLTAGHVVAQRPDDEVAWCVAVLDPTSTAPVFECEVAWQDPDRDLAILRVVREDQLAAWASAVGRAGPVVLTEPGNLAVEAEAVGYPDAALAEDTKITQPELVTGTLLPAQSARTGRMPFDVDSSVPADWRLWVGMSGAALRDGHQRVVGVIVGVGEDRRQQRLYVAVLPDPRVDTRFAAALEAVGAPTVLEAAEAPANRELLALVDPTGRPYTVAGVPQLGEFGARRSRTDVEAYGDPYYPYMPRERDAVLRAALDRRTAGTDRRALVLVGDAAAGKSRTLTEALRHHPVLSGWRLLKPHRTADLRQVVRLAARGGVVWLDDINTYTTGLDPTQLDAAVRALETTPGVVMAGTLRTDQLRSLQDRPELRVTWEVLTDNRLVELVTLESELSAAEAETWYRRAADAGDAQAMYNLGLLLKERGDVARARAAFQKALDSGHQEYAALGREALDELSGDAGSRLAEQFERSYERRQYFVHRRTDTSSTQRPSENQPVPVPMRMIDIRIFWIPSAGSRGTTAPRTLGEDEQPGRIGIQRVASYGPATGLDQDLPIPESPDEVIFDRFGLDMPETEGGRGGYTREQYFQDAFDDYVTNKLADPSSKQSTEVWVTPVYENLTSATDGLSELYNHMHQLIVGEPIRSLSRLIPLGDIAAEVALPGEAAITSIKLLVQITGIVVGLASGQPLLANARLKSLVQDVLPEVVFTEIDDFLTNTLEPFGRQERDFEADPEARNEIARLVAEIKGLVEITRRG
jgi:tetratricopeptide (TPR) repeat protein